MGKVKDGMMEEKEDEWCWFLARMTNDNKDLDEMTLQYTKGNISTNLLGMSDEGRGTTVGDERRENGEKSLRERHRQGSRGDNPDDNATTGQ